MFTSELPAPGSAGNRIRVFVSYDREADADLYDLLAEQASQGISRFEISDRSRSCAAIGVSDEALRRAIRGADQVVVLCGEHTDSSARVGTELRIAQEEERPYLLLWGRRERMCTKPATARPADAMYSWTSEILERQLVTVLRATWSREQLAELSRKKLLRPVESSPPSTPRGARAEPARAGGAGQRFSAATPPPVAME